jgi:predicted RNA methylase
MAKLSTAAQKRHQAVLARLQDPKKLDNDEIYEILENFHEGANHLNGIHGAFFTPPGLAKDFAIHVHGRTVIDLCAGIGSLSYACKMMNPGVRLTCIELNPDYIEVGKRILPDATWYQADVQKIRTLDPDERFDVAISNPPFGNIGGINMFDLEVVRIASRIAKRGVFILPQLSTPFRYSGEQSFRQETTDKLQRWMDANDITFDFNCGVDCNTYISHWKGVKPTVEIVCCEFD